MSYQKKQLSSKDFFIDYNRMLSNVLKNHHFDELSKISIFLKKNIIQKKQIFVCGNGGSASISNHLLCDFNKGIKKSSSNKLIPKTISLTNSIELITAIANDISYSDIFKEQLENLSTKGDTLIIISCSGKSKNILKAIQYAKKNQLNIISFVGFGQNILIKKNSIFYINLKTKNYGIAEDIFQSMMHMLSQDLRRKFMNNSLEIL